MSLINTKVIHQVDVSWCNGDCVCSSCQGSCETSPLFFYSCRCSRVISTRSFCYDSRQVRQTRTKTRFHVLQACTFCLVFFFLLNFWSLVGETSTLGIILRETGWSVYGLSRAHRYHTSTRSLIERSLLTEFLVFRNWQIISVGTALLLPKLKQKVPDFNQKFNVTIVPSTARIRHVAVKCKRSIPRPSRKLSPV